jgi:O-antigen/teichoic acid export membrane protein
MTRGSIARGALWNLAGFGLPVTAAIVAVPVIVRGLGVERFGILALGWAIMGAAAMLDLGLGRALTQVVAKRRAGAESGDLGSVVITTVGFLGALSIVGAVSLGAASSWLATDVFRVAPPYSSEARGAIALLAVSLPFIVCGGALQGVLEGHLRFDLSNLVRIPLSTLNYLVPVAILPFAADLVWIVGGTVVSRAAGFLAYWALVRRVMGPGLRGSMRPRLLRPVLLLAAWMAASTAVAAVIIYLDRFAIGVLLSMAALAFYVTPFEIVSRLAIIPGAVGGALLPAFASVKPGASHEMRANFGRGLRYVVLLVFPAAMLVVLFAHDGLKVWIGDDFAGGSTRVAQILAAGMFVNSLAMVPLMSLYGIGRADIVAKLHLLELPIYALVLWQLVLSLGVEGAALAWSLRALVDAVLLFGISRHICPAHDAHYAGAATAILAGVAALALGALLPSAASRLLYGVVILIAFATYGWTRLLSAQERLVLTRMLRFRPREGL